MIDCVGVPIDHSPDVIVDQIRPQVHLMWGANAYTVVDRGPVAVGRHGSWARLHVHGAVALTRERQAGR